MMKSPARGSDNTKPSATELEVDDAALLTELELDGGLPSRPYLLSFRSFSLSSLPLSFLSFSLSSLPDFRRDLRGVELRGEPAERYICSAFPHICRECQTHTHTQRERERERSRASGDALCTSRIGDMGVGDGGARGGAPSSAIAA